MCPAYSLEWSSLIICIKMFFFLVHQLWEDYSLLPRNPTLCNSHRSTKFWIKGSQPQSLFYSNGKKNKKICSFLKVTTKVMTPSKRALLLLFFLFYLEQSLALESFNQPKELASRKQEWIKEGDYCPQSNNKILNPQERTSGNPKEKFKFVLNLISSITMTYIATPNPQLS